ncbi:MAG: hypothetical protein QXX57_03070 [Nitrososphaerota archaeon]
MNGTAVSPVASGIDAHAILSIQKIAAGRYQINLKQKAKRNILPQSIISATAERVFDIETADKESITIRSKNLAGVDSDADFHISLLWHNLDMLF